MEWFSSTVRKAVGRFGNVSLTVVHDDKGIVTGLIVRKKTVIRSDDKDIRKKDTSTARADKAYRMLLDQLKEICSRNLDAELSLEIQVVGGTLRNVSVNEARNLHGVTIDEGLS